jgi:hypothetical protein
MSNVVPLRQPDKTIYEVMDELRVELREIHAQEATSGIAIVFGKEGMTWRTNCSAAEVAYAAAMLMRVATE